MARRGRAGGPFGSISWGIAPAVKPNDLLGIAATRPDLFGDALHGFMRRAAKHLGLIHGIIETVAQPANRIELAGERDRSGVPFARIVHTLAPESKALWHYANAQGLEVMRAAGATEAWTTPQHVFSHISGGTIMGKDPATSVTDSHGCFHAVPNLFAAGGGLFPSIGAVSPTFSLLALADRTAGELTSNWSRYARTA